MRDAYQIQLHCLSQKKTYSAAFLSHPISTRETSLVRVNFSALSTKSLNTWVNANRSPSTLGSSLTSHLISRSPTAPLNSRWISLATASIDTISRLNSVQQIREYANKLSINLRISFALSRLVSSIV